VECDAIGGHTKLLGAVSVCWEQRPAASVSGHGSGVTVVMMRLLILRR